MSLPCQNTEYPGETHESCANFDFDFSVNFFAGFIISSSVYLALCKLWPVPAVSDRWMEVGDQITEVSLAYDGPEERHGDLDDESASSIKSGSKNYEGTQEVSEAC